MNEFNIDRIVKKTVVVGMSGGVDSSVSAYLLKKDGYDVIGLFMQNWQSEPGEVCTSEIDFKDASLVCDKLDIPLHRANFSQEYWDNVFEEFLSEHKNGRTPNPDILCNREIKFKSFLKYAFTIGADYIATGHYASIKMSEIGPMLCRAKDLKKDQTYFLHEVRSSEFEKCIFPLSNLYKDEVRKIAKDIDLSVSNKKDSVGICFIGERNLKDFLGRFIDLEKGKILDEFGNNIGTHNGATLFTKGQRQGLNIGGIKNKQDLPWYVFDKDINKNEVHVCQGVDNELLFDSGLKMKKINWINEFNFEYPKTALLQVRHQHKPVKCTIVKESNKYNIKFEEKIRAVASGQSAVFYDNNVCLGGGIITETY
ncbi:MAG: tRNA (5-methylaminomethyl-2-thiouridylate)-methyltransferase [SAR86 cluster bacterium SAR86A]|uniref:tRNA-specific 2-thiouridylase MnmA n=1 Tax=SAR86 cluster bacterium SAR86A TaxID=1123866 RepID=J4WTC0_9GAMM|nr:MAG: tRNA (5-methylaminomethyl-2-thiouridylate)-methyltransferase [SAR86 cluster bacterium SAR86A]